MMLAGIPVSDRYVLELAGRLRGAGYDHTAERLETAEERQTKLLGLSIEDREVILCVLADPPEPNCASSARSCSKSTSGGSAKASRLA
jgi:hypothetical protein